MIEELRIAGIGVIDEAHLELGSGLSVITGETGAGKTMILSGVELLRGARADVGQLRDPDHGAEVDAVVLMPSPLPDSLADALDTHGVSTDDDALIIRRTVAGHSGQSKSRAHIGGRAVPVSALSQVWAQLIAVHGQADQARLREASWQRSVVDRSGGDALADIAQKYHHSWQSWQAVRQELDEMRASAEDRERSAALLRLGIAEIDEVAPHIGEDETLDAESAVLTHAGTLRDAVISARSVLSGAGEDIDPTAAISRIAQARERMQSVADIDNRLAEIATRLDSLTNEVTDVDAELGEYLRAIDADPQRQAWVEERRSQLASLRKSYGATLEDVVRWRAESALEVERVDGAADRIEELTAREQELADRVRELAQQLSHTREVAAGELVVAVEAELQALAMPDARVMIEVTSDLDTLRSHGADDISVQLIPHPGASARPIGKGASGGELSRLALAFEVALAQDAPAPTMVFDEVDAGVGGAVAVEVGRRLARLARRTQVIVVTHLAQVAAFADRHLVVTKGSDGTVTTASVREVTDGDRVAELVRMLSGMAESEAGAAHAEELLELGRTERGKGKEGKAPVAAKNSRGAPQPASTSRTGAR
jgi:DNA repair protein RecN (Recombination protein N)